MSRRLLVALALALGAAGCALPDPNDLEGYADNCRTNESCAPGYVCRDQHCVVGPGAACHEGMTLARCERTAGVCAGALRACVNGVAELTCGTASYGARFEPREVSCDGLDNDCDGRTDVMLSTLPVAGDMRWVSTPKGLGIFSFGMSVSSGSTCTMTWSARYQSEKDAATSSTHGLTLDGGSLPSCSYSPALFASVPTGDGALLVWRGLVTSAGSVAPIFFARVTHGPEGAVLAAPVREVSLAGLDSQPQLSLSRDGTRVAAVWFDNQGGMQGRILGLDGTALTEPVTLNAGAAEGRPYSLDGPAMVAVEDGYIVAWHAYGNSAGSEPQGLRVAHYGADLALIGDVRTVPGTTWAGSARMVAGTGGTLGEVQLGWLVQQSGSTAVDVVRPYAAEATQRVLEPISPSFTELNLARAASGDLLLAYPEATTSTSPNALRSLRVRFIPQSGAARDVDLALPGNASTRVAFDAAAEAESAVRAATAAPNGQATLVRVCRP